MMIESYIYISSLRDDDQSYGRMVNNVYQFLIGLNSEYPGFGSWYWNSVEPSLIEGTKEIIIAEWKRKIIGVSIIKKDFEEKKICTLRVDKTFRGNGVGKKLIEFSLMELETDLPFISVSSQRIRQFEKTFRYFGFQLEEKNHNYYKSGYDEYCYNGFLPGSFYDPEYGKMVMKMPGLPLTAGLGVRGLELIHE